MQVDRKQAAVCVQNRSAFDGSNIFGRAERGAYVAYSYGTHWPMFAYVYSEDKWYGHNEKHAVTTSQHTNALRPSGEVIYLDSVAQLNQKISETAK